MWGRDGDGGGPSLNFGKEDKGASTYRMKSRKASNGVNKWKWLAEYIIARPTELMLIYMPFLEDGGIGDFIKYLNTRATYKELVVNKNGGVITGPPSIRGKLFKPEIGDMQASNPDTKNLDASEEPAKSAQVAPDKLLDSSTEIVGNAERGVIDGSCVKFASGFNATRSNSELDKLRKDQEYCDPCLDDKHPRAQIEKLNESWMRDLNSLNTTIKTEEYSAVPREEGKRRREKLIKEKSKESRLKKDKSKSSGSKSKAFSGVKGRGEHDGAVDESGSFPRYISFGANEVVEFEKSQKVYNVADAERKKTSEEEIKYYCIFTGETDIDTRQHLINIMSDNRNMHGRFCHLFFVSSTGTTGIDLRNGRHVISIQPFWHMELWEQLKHRFIRYGSAESLPEDERTVQPIILRSTLPPERNSETGKVEARSTTDMDLFRIGMEKLKLNYEFMDVLNSVTLECLAGVAPNSELCRHCLANNKPLASHESFWRDQYIPNNCIELDDYLERDPEKIRTILISEIDKDPDLKQIDYDGVPYYWKTIGGSMKIYEMHTDRGKLILMDVSHPYYPKLRNMVMNTEA
jgi:hypothetical protein